MSRPILLDRFIVDAPFGDVEMHITREHFGVLMSGNTGGVRIEFEFDDGDIHAEDEAVAVDWIVDEIASCL